LTPFSSDAYISLDLPFAASAKSIPQVAWVWKR